MSKQVMQRALDVLKRVEMVDDDCDIILGPNLFDAVVDAIAELRAEIAKPVEPVGKQYQARDGTWHPFLSEKHAADTILDGT